MKTNATYEEFLQRIRKYKRSPALVNIARFSCEMEKRKECLSEVFFEHKRIDRNSVTVTQDALAFVSSIFAVFANDDRSEFLEQDDLLLLCNWYTNLEYPKPKLQLEILIRLSQEQLPFQDLGTYSFARAYYLMKEVSKRGGYTASIDLEASFYEWVGLSVDDYYWLSWCLFSRVHQVLPSFSLADFLSHDIKTFKQLLTKEKLSKYLQSVAGTVNDLRVTNQEINQKVPESLRKWQFNVLSRYPVFQFPDKVTQQVNAEYLIVNSKLMLNKIVDGPYWSLRDLFLRKAVGGDRGFLSFWGEVFEKYVGELLERIYSKEQVYSLNVFAVPHGIKNADWLVLADNIVYIFECKSPLLPVAVKGALDEEKVNSWCTDNIIKSEAQLSATENRIMTGTLKIEGVDFQGKRVIKILVSLQSLFFEPHWLRHSNQLSGGAVWKDFHILSVAELELFESAKDKVSMATVFDELVTDPSSHNFRSLCAIKNEGRLTSPLLMSVNNKFWAHLSDGKENTST